MRKPWAVFIIAVIAAIRDVPFEAQTDEFAFTHVAVVDVQTGNISPDMTALTSDQKIREVSSSRVAHVPKQAHSADARGRYLIAGLRDMHVHSLWNAERPAIFFPCFLQKESLACARWAGPCPLATETAR